MYISLYVYKFFLSCLELHTSQELYDAFSTHKLLFLWVFSRLKSRYQQRLKSLIKMNEQSSLES